MRRSPTRRLMVASRRTMTALAFIPHPSNSHTHRHCKRPFQMISLLPMSNTGAWISYLHSISTQTTRLFRFFRTHEVFCWSHVACLGLFTKRKAFVSELDVVDTTSASTTPDPPRNCTRHCQHTSTKTRCYKKEERYGRNLYQRYRCLSFFFLCSLCLSLTDSYFKSGSATSYKL